MSTGQHRLEDLLQSPKYSEFHPVLFPLVLFCDRLGWLGNSAIVAVSLTLMGTALFWLDVGMLGCVASFAVFVFTLLGCSAVYENVATKTEHVSETLMGHIRERNTWLGKSRNTKDKELSQLLAPFLKGCGCELQSSWFEAVSRALDVRYVEAQNTAAQKLAKKPRKHHASYVLDI